MPRPSSRPTGAVWRLLEAWRLAHPLRPNQTQMAGLFGISGSLLSNWKYMDSLMQTDDIKLVAEKTGIPFGDVAAAAAEDAPSARAAAARRREADVVVQSDDGTITLIEAKRIDAAWHDLEVASEQVRSYLVALASATGEPQAAEALNERLAEQHRVDDELVEGVRMILLEGGGSVGAYFSRLVEYPTGAPEFDLQLTDDDLAFLDEIKVGDRPLPKAARRMTSAGRAARRRQDEAGELPDIVTETDEEIIDIGQRPRR